MTLNEDAKYTDAEGKRVRHIGRVVDGGLVQQIERDGLSSTGFTVKCGEYDFLLVIKAMGETGAVVAFVGSETLGGAFIKAFKQAKNGGLKWRADQWAK
jgi:hypothetical protein